MEVQAKAYRFLMLNACNARFLNLNLLQLDSEETEITTDSETLRPVNGLPGPQMVQIGNEGGYLTGDVVHTNDKFFNGATFTGNMLLAPAERSDFIIDFSGYPTGTEFIMYNDAPGPFPDGPSENDHFAGNEASAAVPGSSPDTRQLMKFKVVGATTDAVPYTPILSTVVINPDSERFYRPPTIRRS